MRTDILPAVPASKLHSFRLCHSHELNRAALRGDAARRQMAEDYRIYAASAGAVTRDDLRSLGWLPAQIDLFGADAADLARADAADRRAVAWSYVRAARVGR